MKSRAFKETLLFFVLSLTSLSYGMNNLEMALIALKDNDPSMNMMVVGIASGLTGLTVASSSIGKNHLVFCIPPQTPVNYKKYSEILLYQYDKDKSVYNLAFDKVGSQDFAPILSYILIDGLKTNYPCR